MEQEFPRKADRPSIYQYRVDVMLGTGGTGTVYRGMDPKSGNIVAVKLFRANFFRNKLHMKDLKRTANKFRKLSHPNVVNISEFISGKDGEALVLEYVDGPDLKWYLDNRDYNMRERIVITTQICNGLGYLHENGFTHHDLKPANVLFTRKGQVKICDFSLCGSSYLLSVFDSQAIQEQFTPMYVAPEIIRKEKATHLSDLYSLGVMMYLMFTEKVPFEVDNYQKLYMCHLQVEPIHPNIVNPLIPQRIGDIIMKLLEKDPSKRYPDCDSVRIAMTDLGGSRI